MENPESRIGFPDYWYTWRHQSEALADRFQVVAVDLRGYNQSDRPKGLENYSMRALIGDAVAVLAGHDRGGAIARQVALRHPDLVKRLIIVSRPRPPS